ncbi:hypothetical protein MTBBW1_60027 [Desulfamplus magnetovallimortis]|uniref:DUF4340 domain-containing protein n=1 Tax=Desulfamplus magnetovallimortis TaxID=1246637 RepID=A0A1W1HHZ5_9BACT|nr:DUF4340 domain-containing protein [Desulfamplus magnetovallimortis]SLM32127.1 hypothetical protein MTBBW1_60027 [Desulfamplus magnetovallimortis]
MKKEYIIPGVLIVLLSAYLVMHNRDGNNYTLPSIPEINVSDIKEIILEKDGQTIPIAKKDESWKVTEKDYPADEKVVSKMLDIIKEIKVSALISEQGENLNRYELDQEHRISVTVKSSVETLRKFDIGKAAPSFRHTFIRLDGNNSVYHASKSFRRDFEKTVDDIRDKTVLSFNKDKITEVVLSKDDTVMELVLSSDKSAEASEDKSSEESKTDSENEATVNEASVNEASVNEASVKVWKVKQKPEGDVENMSSSPGATELENKDTLDGILSTLSNLKCSQFTENDSKEDAFKGMSTAATITMKGEKTYSIELFVKDNEKYPALSSENAYPFMLDSYQGDNLLKKIDELMAKEEKNTPLEQENIISNQNNNTSKQENIIPDQNNNTSEQENVMDFSNNITE